jgi:Phage protein Gp138 N-terminal domain
MGNSPTSFKTGIGGTSAGNPVLTPPQLTYAESAQWKAILKQALIDLRCAAPAIVQSFDPDTQTVAVQIAMSELVKNPNGPQWTPVNPIYNVPICLPTGGGFSVTLPIQQGDEGLLVFSDTMFDLWWQNGGIQPPAGAPLTQPNHERRRHDVTDCFFIPGLRNQTRLLSDYSTDSMQVRSDDGTVVVDVSLEDGLTLTAPTINLNSTGDINISASGQVKISSGGDDTSIDESVYLMHMHSGVQSGGSETGPVVP